MYPLLIKNPSKGKKEAEDGGGNEQKSTLCLFHW